MDSPPSVQEFGGDSTSEEPPRRGSKDRERLLTDGGDDFRRSKDMVLIRAQRRMEKTEVCASEDLTRFPVEKSRTSFSRGAGGVEKG